LPYLHVSYIHVHMRTTLNLDDALVERARRRSQDVPEETVAAVIGEALRAVRAQSRS